MRKFGKIFLTLFLAINSFIGTIQIQAESSSKDDGIVLNVTDYGADPSGKLDSTNALKEALEDAKKSDQPVTINFPKGEYHFWKDYATKRIYHTSNTSSLSYPEKMIAILMEDMKDVTLEGNGSSLIMHGDMMAIATVRSSNIEIHDFVLDYKDADTVDISVVGNGQTDDNKNYTDFYIPANYNYQISQDAKNISWKGETSPITGKPYWEVQNADFCVMLVIYKGYDQTVARSSDKAAANPFKGVTHIEKVKDNVLRFTYSGDRPTDQEKGNTFLLSDSGTRRTTGAFFYESENLRVKDMDIHYLSGFGWLTQMCKDVEFNNVDFLPRYGSGKFTTSNADQLHVAGCGGYFNVIDCNFSIAHDDPINIHGSYMRVQEVIDNQTVRVAYINGQQGGFQQFHPGDEVLFYSRTYLEAADGVPEDKPVVVKSSIGPGEEYNGSKLDMRNEVITFEKPLSEETLNDLRQTIQVGSEKQALYVAENITYTPEVVIRGNHMKSIPTRGILCTTRKPVIIEDNVFDNMAMANIFLSNDADYWYESGPIRNMIIRNNEFFIRPTGQAEWGDVSGVFIDPVMVRPNAGTPVPPKKGNSSIHKNIAIEENTFHMANDNVVTANSVDTLTIKDNTIVRDDPKLGLTLSLNEEMGVGKTQILKTNATEKTLSKDLFRFNNCKNVTIEGNHYDDGLNLNVRTAGSMTNTDIHILDSELTLNNTAGNIHKTASDIRYVSSNPEVAYVNEQGELVAVKEGQSNIQAYMTWNGTMERSNVVTVSVQGNQGSDLTIDSDETYFTEEEAQTQINVNADDVTYKVLDPLTGKGSDRAIVDAFGVYTAKKDGVVLVEASTKYASVDLMMVNSFAQSYGDVNQLDEQVLFENKHSDKLFGIDKNTIGIQAETGSELYGPGKYVNNLIKYKIDNDMKNDLRIQIDVDGMPIREGGWNNTGVMLFKDGDNYYSIGKKNHYQGITTVYEQNATSNETGGSADENTLTASTFEIEVIDGFATLRFKDANGNWKVANSRNVMNLIQGDVYLALTSWMTGGPAFSTAFGNIKIAKASETTTEDMSNVNALALFKSFNNERPTVEKVELADGNVNDEVTLTYDAQDNDQVDQMLYAWSFTDLNGVKKVSYTKDANFVPKAEGELQVTVIALDKYGKPSQPVASNKANIENKLNTGDTLHNIYINGNAIRDFDPNGSQFTFILPDESNQMRISYDAEDAGVRTLIKYQNGEVAAELENENSAVINNDGQITITRGAKTYTIVFEKLKDNQANLQELHIGSQQIDLNDVIKEGTNSYFVEADEENIVFQIVANEQASNVKMTRSFFLYDVVNEAENKNEFTSTVDLTAGVNAFEIEVTAADGKTKHNVHLYVFKDGFTNDDLESIKVDGERIEEFNPDQKEYTIYVNEPQEISIEAGAMDGQTTSITSKGERVEGTNATFKVEKGLNTIIVQNTAKNMWDVNYYTLNVVVVTDNNADLLSLTSDELLPGFDPSIGSYNINMNNDSITLHAKAQVNTANITMRSAYETMNAQGEATHTFPIYEGENKIYITVTANDGITKRQYVLHIQARGYEYASNIQEEFASVGYGSLGKDVASSGGPIALMNEDSQKVVFDKGLGAHASSVVIYNIEGKGYTSFETYVGVDYFQVAQNSAATVGFTIEVDGVKQFTSGVMTVRTPMKQVKLDVTGASTIKLIIDNGGDNINYDHADWADAKFVKPLPEAPAIEDDTTFMKTILKQAIDKADSFIESADYATLSEYVKDVLNTRLMNAKNVYASDSATLQECFDVWKQLADVLHYCDFKADKTLLQSYYNECSEIDLSEYVEGVAEFEQALANTKEVLDDNKALQNRIDEAYTKLQDARNGLKKAESGDVDKTMLEYMVKLVDGVVSQSDRYVQNEQWNTLLTALDQAKEVFNQQDVDQKTVDLAVQNLAKAYEDIRLKPDEALLAKLTAFIGQTSSIERRLYSVQDLRTIDNIRQEAQQMLDGESVTQEQYDAFEVKMMQALDIIKNNQLQDVEQDDKIHVEAPMVNANDKSKENSSIIAKTGDTTQVVMMWGLTVLAGSAAILSWKKSKKDSK